MADKLMYIVPIDNTQNYHFSRLQVMVERLDSKLYEPTNQNLIKVPKIVKPTNKKNIFKTLGTSVIDSPMSTPPYL